MFTDFYQYVLKNDIILRPMLFQFFTLVFFAMLFFINYMMNFSKTLFFSFIFKKYAIRLPHNSDYVVFFIFNTAVNRAFEAALYAPFRFPLCKDG